jgi:hypothetical protein
MARVRVFLLTHRRPALLRRALASLLAQTFTDWVCELHNDAPGDSEPRVLLTELASDDARFIYHDHASNWGAVAAFNHAFAGGQEPFASLLEDDNWWEPEFLAHALSALDARPAAALVWANMRVWQEQPGGAWTDTGQTIWQTSPATPPLVEFRPPEIIQAFDALHSNGAMVFRPNKFRAAGVPTATPFAIIEPLRERAATGPLLLLTAPLANFARTLATARDADPARWLQAKLLVAASFFSAVPVAPAVLRKIWATQRAQRPRDTGVIFCVALALRDARLVGPATVADWFAFLAGALRHPRRLVRSLRFRRDHAETWTWLVAQTAASAATARATVTSKQL